jgi:acylphosphatase
LSKIEHRMAIRLRIHGRVQGVWYRGWLVEEAVARSVDGWARNRADGTVEAVLAGEPGAVRSLIERCREGPRLARVQRIDEAPVEETPAPGFVQLPTL